MVITFFAVTLAPKYRQQIVTSHSGRLVADIIVRADTYLPKEIHDTIDPFVRQFEQQFRQPGMQPTSRTGSGEPSTVAGDGPSPLQAIWNGVSSAAAWTGAEQGGPASPGPTQAGGLPQGSSWFAPRQANPPATQPAGYQIPSRPTASGFTSGASGPPPQPFPIGAQSPLPVR